MFTSIAEKIMAGVIALLVIGGTGLGLLYRHERTAYQKASADLVSTKALYDTELAANSALKRDNDAQAAAYAQLTNDLAALQKTQLKEHTELQDALKANAEWSDTAVPDAVFDSVFGPDAADQGSSNGNGPTGSDAGRLPARR